MKFSSTITLANIVIDTMFDLINTLISDKYLVLLRFDIKSITGVSFTKIARTL